jgi:hypothetical protein
MSRINRPRIEPGDEIAAADLNARFDDYSQPGALDVANHGLGAIDLPQIQAQKLITLDSKADAIGTGVWDHTSPQNIAASGASPPTLTELGGAGNGRLALGAGYTLNPGDLLRVYWNLGAEPNVTGRPYAAPGLGTLAIDNGSGGATDLNDCFACWVAHLQWDTTSALLNNFAAVPGQSDFTPGFSSVQSLAGSSLIPAYLEYSPEGHAANGQMSSAPTQKALRWMGTQGSWFTARGPTSTVVTVYGLRIVVSGIYHAAFVASDNRLELFTALAGSCTLDLSQGRLTALHQRLA